MADIRAKIPGWREAVVRETQAHDDAFAFPYDDICGFKIRHLSLIDMIRLSRIGNFLFDGTTPPITAFYVKIPKYQKQVAEFISYQSIYYNSRLGILNRLRVRRAMKLDQAHLYAEVMRYLDRTYMDNLGRTESHNGKDSGLEPNYWSGIIDYVDLIGKEYGYRYTEVMQMPYRIAIQMVRRITKRNNPKAVLGTETQKALASYTRSKRENKEVV